MRSLVCCPLCICKSYLVSRLLSVANTLVQRSKTLVQRCKHACAAFQKHTRLFSVANPFVQRYRTLVQRCRRLCSAPHLHSLLTEGSAAWAVALKYKYGVVHMYIYIYVPFNKHKLKSCFAKRTERTTCQLAPFGAFELHLQAPSPPVSSEEIPSLWGAHIYIYGDRYVYNIICVLYIYIHRERYKHSMYLILKNNNII